MNYDWNKMVEITVPVGINGWVYAGSVTINGVTVDFPIGVPTTVPEPVAELLKKFIALEEDKNKVPAQGAGGKFIVRVTKGEQMEPNPMPEVFVAAFTATMDKPFSEVLEAAQSGKLVECWEVNADGQTMVYTMNVFGETGCSFYTLYGQFVMMVTYQSDGTAYWLSND